MTVHDPGARPWLFVVSDRRRLCAAAGRPIADAHHLLVAQAGAAAAAGVTAFQVRERDLDGRALHALVGDVAAVVAGRLQVLVNDRADVAAAVGVGVHLRASSMAASRLRPWLPPGTWITRSVHERAELASAGPVTAVVAGAVRETVSKPAGHAALGGDGLADLVARVGGAGRRDRRAVDGGLAAAASGRRRRAGRDRRIPAAVRESRSRAPSIAPPASSRRSLTRWTGSPNIASSSSPGAASPGGPDSMVLDTAEDLGAALRHHREAAHRSLREMADATKLGVRTLEALERNHVEKLPPGIFRRAVVRAYAREVGLDPEDTLRVFLARHPDDLPPPGPSVGPIADAEPRPARVSPLQLMCVVLAAIVVLVLAAWALGWTTPAAGDRPAPATHRRPAPAPGPRGV